MLREGNHATHRLAHEARRHNRGVIIYQVMPKRLKKIFEEDFRGKSFVRRVTIGAFNNTIVFGFF